MTDRDWIAGEHVLQRRGLRWPPGFFTGQAGCFCCTTQQQYYYSKAGISVPCCTSNVPSRLTATVTADAGNPCACFNVTFTVPLVYQAVAWTIFPGVGTNNWWAGNYTPDPCRGAGWWFYVGLTCYSTYWRMFVMQYFDGTKTYDETRWNLSSVEATGAPGSLPVICDPFYADGRFVTTFCSGANARHQVVITE